MARSDGKPMVRREPDVVEGEFDEGGSAGLMVAAPGMMQTRTQYATAIRVQVPRTLAKVEKAVLDEAARMGEDWFYSWQVRDKNSPTGFSTVEGTTVDGAMVLVRNFGNCAVPVRVAGETVTHFYLEATFVDHETGVTLTRMFRQRKSQRAGDGMEAERQQDIAFQIGQSKAQRNCVVKAMPAWMVKAAMEEAKKAAAAGIGPRLPALVAEMVKAFAALKVDEAAMTRRLDKPKSAWGPNDVVLLRAVYRAIRDGESSVANEFPPPDAAAPGTMPAQGAPPPAPGSSPAATPAAAPTPAQAAPDTMSLCKHDILRVDCAECRPA